MRKIIIFSGIALLAACVPARKFDETVAKYETSVAENKVLKQKAMTAEEKYNELTVSTDQMRKNMEAIKRDTSVMGRSLRNLTSNYDQLDKTYRELLDVNDRLHKGNAADADILRKKYEAKLKELHDLQDQANQLKTSLGEKEQKLAKMETELQTREKRVKELESVINRKDSVVRELKNKLSAALLGFENNGLTITMKDGKVYVSLENQLLFKSGSYDVDEKGKDALRKLAKVLEQNPDINVTVEGHTDTDKFGGSGSLKDNWDLSVMRATQIVKLLVNSATIDAKRITASGRGEFFPLDPSNTDAAKKKNRRTEIILTPKLDELYQMLNEK